MRTVNLLAFLSLFVWNQKAEAADGGYFDAYLEANISQCEQKNLQKLWKTDDYDTKMTIGQKIVENQNIVSEIKKAHKAPGASTCDFWAHGFSYLDAERMSIIWGVDTDDAKLKLAAEANKNSFAKAYALIPEDMNVEEARANQKDSAKSPATTESKTMDTCYAMMIKDSYEVTLKEATTMMKDAMNYGYLEDKLSYARETIQKKYTPEDLIENGKNPCKFSDSRFTYDDAVKLSTMWSISVNEAKAALAQKYVYGLERDIAKELKK